MLEIYFDGVLLDQDKYLGLTQKGTMFDKEFKLGTTASREFKLKIPKADFNPNTKEVLIKYMSNDYAHLIIDKYTYTEGGVPTVDLTLVDKMVLANFNYDASIIVPTTTLGILQDICNKIGVELGNTDFANNDVEVDFYDSTVQARQYIGYIAEVAGGFARIEADGKLYIRSFNNNTTNMIIPELCEEIIIGQAHQVERVVLDNGITKMEKMLQSSNLFDASKIGNASIVVKNNGKVIQMPILTTGNGVVATNNTLQELCPNLKVGDVAILNFKRSINETINPFIYLVDVDTIWYKGSNNKLLITEPMLNSKVSLYGNRFVDGEVDQVSLIEFKINKDVVETWEQFGDIQKINVGKNICPTDVSDWELGHWGINGDKEPYGNRIRLINLIPCQPNTQYYVNTFLDGYNYAIREFKEDMTFNKSVGAVFSGNVFTTSATSYYLAVSMYSDANTTTLDLVRNGELKPFICLNSETDKSYEPYNYQGGNLETLYINSDNVYVNSEEAFKKLTDNILGFKYWNIDTGNTYILPTTMFGDVLKLTYENQDYYTIEQFDEVKFQGTWQGKYKLELDSTVQQETKVAGINTQVKAIKVNLNRLDNVLQIAVTDISSQKDADVELLNKIQANQTLIEQTAKDINQSVTEITGNLSANIDDVASDLKEITGNLNDQIITQQTLIQQLKDSITSTIKTTGGNNLLRNSVGLAGTDFWETTGNVVASQDSYTEQNTVSGSKFVLTGEATLKQSYITQNNLTYGVSFKLRHIINGTANPVYVRIHRNETDYRDILVEAEQTTEYTNFQEFNEYTYLSVTGTPYIEVINTGDDIVEISDLIISLGENQSWSGYSDEVYGKEHRLDKYGLKLSDLASGDYTNITNNNISLVNDGQVVAELSKTQAKSDSGYFTNKIQVGTLQMVSLDENNIVEYV